MTGRFELKQKRPSGTAPEGLFVNGMFLKELIRCVTHTTLHSARVTVSGNAAHDAGVVPECARIDICVIDFHAANN